MNCKGVVAEASLAEVKQVHGKLQAATSTMRVVFMIPSLFGVARLGRFSHAILKPKSARLSRLRSSSVSSVRARFLAGARQ
eukprot:scaffold447_cov307-Pinguiococcus_pyrenoidosus.AAC.48